MSYETKGVEIIAPGDTSALDDLQRQLRQVETERDQLLTLIRQMDQEIWNMSQRTSWEGMRPHYVKLLNATNERKELESRRIRDLLIPEMRKTYLP